MKLRKTWKKDALLAFVIGFIITMFNWYLLPEFLIYSIPIFFALFSFSVVLITSVEDRKKAGQRKDATFTMIVSIDCLVLIESAFIAFMRTERDLLTRIAVSTTIFSCIVLIALLFALEKTKKSSNN